MRRLFLLSALTILAAAGAFAQADCRPSQIALTTDGENGKFDGMSHSGTALIFENRSAEACRLRPFPQIEFADGEGRPLKVTVESGEAAFRGPIVDGKRLPMGPGPVVLPVTLAAGAKASADLRWVSNTVYEHTVCVHPATLHVKIGTRWKKTPVEGQICGPDAEHVKVTANKLVLATGQPE